MFSLNLSGVVTSKYALHLPVIRHWHIVWERVEFGTRTHHIEKSVRIPVERLTEIPQRGFSVDVGSVEIGIRPVAGGLEGHVTVLDGVFTVARHQFAIPKEGHKVFDLRFDQRGVSGVVTVILQPQ